MEDSPFPIAEYPSLEKARNSVSVGNGTEGLLLPSFPGKIWTLENLRDVRKSCALLECNLLVFDGDDEPMEWHKDLFVAASPIFADLVKVRRKADGIYTLILLGVERCMFKLIRDFLYEEELPSSLDLETTLRLMEISFLYSIVGIVAAAADHASKLITPEVVFQVLEAARRLECTKLQEEAVQTIIKNADELVKSEDFLDMGCHDICRILSSDELAWKEIHVLEIAKKWANKRVSTCEHEDSTTSLPKYLAQVITCVRFPIMSPPELTNATLDANIQSALKPGELIQLFQYALLPESDKWKVTISPKFVNRPRSRFSKNATWTVSAQSVMNTAAQVQVDSSVLSISPIPNQRKRSSCYDDDAVETGNSEVQTEMVPLKVQRIENDYCIDHVDDLFRDIRITNEELPTFEALARLHLADDKPEPVIINVSNVDLCHNYQTLELQQCSNLIVDVGLKFVDKFSLSQFITHFDPMRYMLLNSEKEKLLSSAEHIWSLERDEILLKFNGVVFLHVQHLNAKNLLTLNYVRDSLRILSNPDLEPTHLSLSNCEFSMLGFKKGRGKLIQKLVLYRVWGIFTLEEILKRFPKLKELMVWKYAPDDTWGEFLNPLCLDFSGKFAAFANIRKLVLYGTELIFPERGQENCVAKSVTELVLDHCNTLASRQIICDYFPVLFPSLKRLVITEQKAGELPDIAGNLAKACVINCIRKHIKSVEWILMEGMKWSEDRGNEDDIKLGAFLEKTGRGEVERPENFEMEKKHGGKWTWRLLDEQDEGPQNDEEFNRDAIEFQWWNLKNFYDNVSVFQEYFLQDNFPRPIYWI